MAAEIDRAHPGASVSLLRGGRGVFDVCVGDDRIFSKRDAGRFPEDGEVVALLDALLDAPPLGPR